MLKTIAAAALALLVVVAAAPQALAGIPVDEPQVPPVSLPVDVAATASANDQTAEGGGVTEGGGADPVIPMCMDHSGVTLPCTDNGDHWNGYCYEHVASTNPWDENPRFATIWQAIDHRPGYLVTCREFADLMYTD
jgi:hypothetical protein